MRSLAMVLAFATALGAFPVPKPGTDKTLAGSTWKGPVDWTGSQKLTQVLTFHENGSVTLLYAQFPDHKYSGEWKQDNDKLSFHFHTPFSRTSYEAILEGDELKGTGKDNNTDRSATFSAKREVPK